MADNNQQFTWVKFYEELADRLLEYKDDRKKLLEKLKALDKEWIPHLWDKKTNGWKFSDIDPFSIFAVFNRQIKNITRKEIAQRLKELFQLKSERPLDFSGIPTAHHDHRIYFNYQKVNIGPDINALWDLFESAINYPNDNFSSLFDKVLNLSGIGLAKITIALYWIRPYNFIPLDKHTQKYLTDNGIQITSNLSGNQYLELINAIKHDKLFSNKSFYKISLDAWLSNHSSNDGTDDDNDEDQEPDSFITNACNLLRMKKNIILQGAPGTGKTYTTAAISLSILGENINDFKNHKELMKKYEVYRKEKKQLFFTTFHQSMDYEDFVEGVKPELTDNGISYEIKKGIFRLICESARSLFNEKKSNEIDFTKTRIFKMSLGQKDKDDADVFAYCIENSVIALGWGENKDFSKCQNSKEIQALYADEPDNKFGKTAMERFRFWMQIGDIVLISNGNSAVKAIAKIVGDYEFHDDAPIDMCQFRKVEWLYVGNNIPVSRFIDNNFSQQSIYGFFHSDSLGTSKFNGNFRTEEINKIITGEVNTEEPQPYVLIIDEINRGNVSKIFGELVTLLEKDKRDGGDHPITVTLPYSKEKFSVPSNVYIIGTMNTTDRSTGTIDYAVRRRFAFVTLKANENVLPENSKARALFKNIEAFINKYHSPDMDMDDLMVGHSYFMTDKDVPLLPEEQLKLKILYEVIPLLKEYCNDGLLTCSQKTLDDHIKKWVNLELFGNSETPSPAATEQDDDGDQE